MNVMFIVFAFCRRNRDDNGNPEDKEKPEKLVGNMSDVARKPPISHKYASAAKQTCRPIDIQNPTKFSEIVYNM